MNNIFTCIDKVKRDKNIMGYTLLNINNGEVVSLNPNKLKKLLVNKAVIVNNLKLTSDNRIIEVNNKDTLIEKYIDSCNLLGIKPLNIIYANGKYTVVDIPKETSIIIPKFVNNVCIRRDLNRHTNSEYTHADSKSTDEMVKILKKLCSNTNKVVSGLNNLDCKTDSIIHNQQIAKEKSEEDLSNIQRELSTIVSKIENMPDELNIVYQYVQELTKEKIEDNRKYALALNNITPDILNEDTEVLFMTHSILDKSSISNNSKMIRQNSNILVNEKTYSSIKNTNDLHEYIPFDRTDCILPYINYSANVYAAMYEQLLLRFDIQDNCKPANTENIVTQALGFVNYILSGCLIGCIISNPASLQLSSALAVAFASGEMGKNMLNELPTLSINHVEFAKNRKRRKMIKQFTSYINEQFPEIENQTRDINNILDKEIYIFAIESVLLHCDDYITRLNKDNIYNKAILKTLYRLLYSDSVNFEEISLPVKASYLAACIFVNENCKFKNDFTAEEIYYVLSKKSNLSLGKAIKTRAKLNSKELKIFDRQTYYYAFVLKYFEVSLYKCNLTQSVVDEIISIFIEEASALGLTPANITVEQFNRPSLIDISTL